MFKLLLSALLCMGCNALLLIESIPKSSTAYGSAPFWDGLSQSLYYVDQSDGRLLRYAYQGNRVFACKVNPPDSVAFIVPLRGSLQQFAVGVGGGRVMVVAWDGVTNSCKMDYTLFEVPTAEGFFDGKCDPYGRLLASAANKTGQAKLYMYDGISRNVSIALDNMGEPRGFEWDKKRGKLYVSDAKNFDLLEFVMDFRRGVASHPLQLFKWHDSRPTGLTIDTNGNLYVAVSNGSGIYVIQSSTGKFLRELIFPFVNVTSLAFGGPKMDELFVTTTGLLYKVKGLGATGQEMRKLKWF